jgi:hypothetical protein
LGGKVRGPGTGISECPAVLGQPPTIKIAFPNVYRAFVEESFYIYVTQ